MASFSLKFNFKVIPKELHNVHSIGNDSINKDTDENILKDECGLLLTTFIKDNHLSKDNMRSLIESVELHKDNENLGKWNIDEIWEK